MESRRVLIVGWDGASFNLLRPWVDEGRLPNLAKLLHLGAAGDLESVLPTVSPAAWTSALTGALPERHGIFGFVKPDPQTCQPKLTSTADRRVPAIWEVLSGSGIDSAFLWVPATYPPEPLRGVMVSGMGTPGVYADFTYPEMLRSELLGRFGPDIAEPDIVGRGPEDYLQELRGNIEIQSQAAHYILQAFNPQVSMIVFTQSDRVQHFFWEYMDPADSPQAPPGLRNAVLDVYQDLDRVLGEVMSTLGPNDYLILLSDHGAGPIRKEVCVDLLLRDIGLLSFEGGRASPIGTLPGTGAAWILNKASLLARSRLPRDWVARLQHWSQTGLLSRLRRKADTSLASPIDWGSTTLFPVDVSGALYWAPRSRSWDEKEAEAVRTEAAGKLLSFRDRETGESPARSVHRYGHLDGMDRSLSPALAVEWADGYQGALCKGKGRAVLREPSVWPGARDGQRLSSTHRIQGVLAAMGPGIPPGTGCPRARLVDIVPTILGWLGLAVPRHVQGEPLWKAPAVAKPHAADRNES